MKSYNEMVVVVGKTAEILVSSNLHAICISTDFTSMHILVPPYTACDEYLIFPQKWTISKESNHKVTIPISPEQGRVTVIELGIIPS